MNAKPATQRSGEYHQQMKARGLRRMSVWIPDNPEAVESIKASAKRLRKKFGNPLPND